MRFAPIAFFGIWITAAAAQPEEWFVYDVQPGDTLWDVSEEFLGAPEFWPSLRRFNVIPDPYHLAPGSQVRIPMEWVRSRAISAKVTALQGSGTLRSALDPNRKPLRVDEDIYQGEEVCAADASNVTLRYADGSTQLLEANSCLILEKSVLFGSTSSIAGVRTKLQRGETENRTTPQRNPSSRFEIHTPSVSVSVRGTEYRVGTVEQPPASRIEVLSSKVKVSGGHQVAQINAGFGVLADTDGKLTKPLKLLPPPELSHVPDTLTRVPIRVTVPAVTGAGKYRLQIATVSDFTSLVADTVTTDTNLKGPDLPDGSYLMRVRAITPAGLEGQNADRPFILDARPEPPFLQNPASEAAVPDERPTFTWTESLEAKFYHFQLARDAGFGELLAELKDYDDTSHQTDTALPPGTYVWRVRVTDRHGNIGPYSDPQQFRVIIAPKVDEPEVGDDNMTFRWRADEAGSRYQIQIAKDEKFSDLLVEQTVAESQLVIPRPPHGTYFLRVRAIAADGAEGVFGTPQKIKVPGGLRWYYLLPLFALFAI